MVNITLFEIHLDDATMTANAPFSGEEDGGAETDGTSAGDGDGGGLPVAPLVGLVVLAVLALAAKKLLDGDDLETVEVGTE